MSLLATGRGPVLQMVPSSFAPSNLPRTSLRVEFAGGGGWELAGIIDRPESSARHFVVFSHCFTCNKDLKAIVRISRALAESGVAVLRYDMTGLGDSRGEFAETNLTTQLADLAAAIAFARKHFGRVDALMGHSFGGLASLMTAGTPPMRHSDLTAVITLAAPNDSVHLAKLLATMNPAIEREGEGEVVIGGRKWRIPLAMLEDFRRHDAEAALGRVDVPVLSFHSPDDETVSIDHQRRIAETVPTEVTAIPLSGSDHLMTRRQSDLGYVADVTAAFLARQTSSDASKPVV